MIGGGWSHEDGAVLGDSGPYRTGQPVHGHVVEGPSEESDGMRPAKPEKALAQNQMALAP